MLPPTFGSAHLEPIPEPNPEPIPMPNWFFSSAQLISLEKKRIVMYNFFLIGIRMGSRKTQLGTGMGSGLGSGMGSKWALNGL